MDKNILYIPIPFTVSEIICVKCGDRYISARPQNTLLKNLECKKCGSGYMIETGQNLQNSYER